MTRFACIRCFTKILAAVVLVLAAPVTSGAADLDRRQRAVVTSLAAKITRAGREYFEGRYERSAREIREALKQVHEVSQQGSPELYDAIVSHIDKISRAHALLELEGISLPPFERPPRPTAKTNSAGQENTEPSDMPAGGISFVKDVAPILNSRCGRCHVGGNRGGFSLATYNALMKGPPEGVVVFAGDVIGSRLIETIETGDMPRGGGRVPAAELKLLKDWILAGAKFDGPDPNQSIALSGSPTATPAEMPVAAPTPKITQATGKETVSFANDVAPLLVENCSGCHLDAMQNSGGLRMDTFAGMMRGGDSGAMITPGRGEASLLVQKLRGTATDGQRMPGGGRPPLADDAIALISKWIDEGATIDANDAQPVKVISRLAWAAKATSSELSDKRLELAKQSLTLAFPDTPAQPHITDHFQVIGTSSPETLEWVGQLAEKRMKLIRSLVRPLPGQSTEDYFTGRATVFVMPRRYDYSEFATMAEQRSVPANWSAHWKSDGIDAYIAIVASDTDSPEQIENRLLAPLASLAVAARGADVPRWFAHGIGQASALKQNATSRTDKEKLQTLAATAASSVKDAKAFLDNRLTPEQADSFATALTLSMMDRTRRKGFEKVLRNLGEGASFGDAFLSGFGVTPTVYINGFLQYAR